MSLGWREPGTRQTVLGLERREAAHGMRRKGALPSSEPAIVEVKSCGYAVVKGGKKRTGVVVDRYEAGGIGVGGRYLWSM